MRRNLQRKCESGKAIEPWIIEPSTELLRTGPFTVHKRAARSMMHPERGGEFVYLDCPAWVNIIALTPPPGEMVVLIEQYRHGLNEIVLEIPGGAVDEGERPLDACLRELREETGYSSEDAEIIGWVSANPAIQNNRVYTALARNTQQVAAPSPDEQEEIHVRLIPIKEVIDLLRSGGIHHSLVVAAFMHLILREPGLTCDEG